MAIVSSSEVRDAVVKKPRLSVWPPVPSGQSFPSLNKRRGWQSVGKKERSIGLKNDISS